MRALIAGALILMSASAYGAKGDVTHSPSGCDYFLVETPMGFALLEWYSGNTPARGDTIVGDYEEYGFKDIYNVSADAEVRVWVEEYWLDREEGLEKLYEECG